MNVLQIQALFLIKSLPIYNFLRATDDKDDAISSRYISSLSSFDPLEKTGNGFLYMYYFLNLRVCVLKPFNVLSNIRVHC